MDPVYRGDRCMVILDCIDGGEQDQQQVILFAMDPPRTAASECDDIELAASWCSRIVAADQVKVIHKKSNQ